MNWPAVGGLHLNRVRAVVLVTAVIDAILTLTGTLTPLAILLTLGLIIWSGLLLTRIALRRTKLVWHMRNRLIVTYLFMGAVPITLILGLFLVLGWLLTAQFAGYLEGSAIGNREAAIQTPARLLARALAQDRMAIVQQLTASGNISFEALVTDVETATDGETFRYPPNSSIEMPPGDWKDYTGIVAKGGDYFMMALANSGRNRSVILEPLTPETLANLVPGLGSLRMPIMPVDPAGPAQERIAMAKRLGGVVPPQWNVLDFEVLCSIPIEMVDWNRPASATRLDINGLTRLSAVLGVVTTSERISSEISLDYVYILIALLGVALLISLYIGVSMTRAITGAIHNLYEGTTRIGAGDFASRIPVRGHDQLADLGQSFNKMAGQLESLVAVAREKERLQSEIAIASEVQTRLFPRRPPAAHTIEMLGVCHAARMVSGDYYDYFTAADGELALALGDVAGKGISAALLMASIQSIMRTQLSDTGIAINPANVVGRLNRLLYASTSAEKYATFFFGLYNEQTRQMVYTNGGHLPPLLIRGESYEFLEVTGSVVGAFPSLHYEEQTVILSPGDLLVAYTDGITEPENAYGEDFGAERLAEIVMRHRRAEPAEIVAKVLEAVRHWDTAEEQSDDMTLMIVRGIE